MTDVELTVIFIGFGLVMFGIGMVIASLVSAGKL